jgi:uncharacterized protein (DUF1330 family)
MSQPPRPTERTIAMAKGYVILTEAIHDSRGMATYEAASMASLIEFKGRVLIVDDAVEVLEGTWHGTRTVVVEYDSVEQARAWHDSASYRDARPIRQAAAHCNVVVVEGFTLQSTRS